uniref:Alternative protein KLHL15 n=1 Tax=Homo sapiens TaxID=9606 RepID=L8EB72_HUMAN|nr:alternative protein KLHL15 [Homo sapiens]
MRLSIQLRDMTSPTINGNLWILIQLTNMDMRGQCSITNCLSPVESPHLPPPSKCACLTPAKKGP